MSLHESVSKSLIVSANTKHYLKFYIISCVCELYMLYSITSSIWKCVSDAWCGMCVVEVQLMVCQWCVWGKGTNKTVCVQVVKKVIIFYYSNLRYDTRQDKWCCENCSLTCISLSTLWKVYCNLPCKNINIRRYCFKHLCFLCTNWCIFRSIFILQ